MFLYGKERKFKKTVRAIIELGKISPGGNISRLGEIVGGDNSVATMEVGEKIIIALNSAHEHAEHVADPSYTPDPLTVDQVAALDYEQFADLLMEAMEAFGDMPKVKTEPKKNGAAKAKS